MILILGLIAWPLVRREVSHRSRPWRLLHGYCVECVVNADPVDWTPHVLDGEVDAVAQVGNLMVIGGTFTQVQDASGGTTYVRPYLAAFDAATGHRKWFANLYSDRGRDLDVGATPVLFNLYGREVVAQASDEGLFAVLDASNGAVLWSKELVSGSAVHGLIASPAYDGNSVYVGSASPPTGALALDPSNGNVKWRHDTAQPIYSAPAVTRGVVVFGTGAVFGDLGSGSVVALSSTDGHVLWSYDTRSAVRSGPAVAGDLVVVGDFAGDVLAFRPGDLRVGLSSA